MSSRRLLLGLAGAAAFVFGYVAMTVPGVAGLVPVDPGAADADLGYLLVAAVGALAVLLVLVVLGARAVFGIDQADPPAPETPMEVPRPGESFDEFVSGDLGLRERLVGDRYREVERRLHQTAVETVMREQGLSRDEARRAVEQGTWTDDEEAAGFLASSWTPPLRTRLLAAVRGRSAFQRGARRAAEAIARQGGDR